MSTHTPGEWNATFDREWNAASIHSPSGILADVHRSRHCDANARLIAAAPDLLAALEACPLPSTMGSVSDHYQRFYDWYHSRARAAISKANGAAL